MKVILKQDVKGLGKKDEIVNASDGYAKNYLIPRGIAVEATSGNVNETINKQKALADKNIADAIKNQFKIEIDKKKIVLDDPIKTAGEHKVEIRIYAGVVTSIIVNVVI